MRSGPQTSASYRIPSERIAASLMFVIATTLVGLLSPRGSAATATSPTEHELKAAFIFNFTKFITWPAPPAGEATFVIGVFGESPMRSALESFLRGRFVGQRPIEVRRISDLVEMERCAVVFVPESEVRRAGELMERLRHRSLVTIGESEDFVGRGGIIGFRWEGNKLRFEVNLDAAEAAGLKISGQLSRLALRVVRSRRTEDP